MASKPNPDPTTYQEWLEHHHRVSGPALVALMIKNFEGMMIYGKIKKQEE